MPALAPALALIVAALCVAAIPARVGADQAATGIALPPSDTVQGYVALLLVNETPLPGKKGCESEADTKAAMLAILWVLESRLRYVPDGYHQEQVASVRCDDIIDVITAGGEKGQCDGFYRDDSGRPVTVPRVTERIEYLVQCANKGEPGRFARLLAYAGDLASAYVKGGITEADRFASLHQVDGVAVTGRAYSWMTDQDCYHPGGSFVRITDAESGSMGGNRFYTLRSQE